MDEGFWDHYVSCFEGNTQFGLYANEFNDGRGKFAAMSCWWGDESGPSGDGPGTGDAITSNVNYSPWALESVCSPLTDVDETERIPSKFVLYPPYPNPFNPTTMIRFDLPRSVHVRLCIYNGKGNLISTIIDRPMTEGCKEVNWTAKDNRGRASI